MKTSKIKPLTPAEVSSNPKACPEDLVTRVNRLLCQHWDGEKKNSVVYMTQIQRIYTSEASERLDVAYIIVAFREAGWSIEYVGVEKDRERGGPGFSHLIFTCEDSN